MNAEQMQALAVRLREHAELHRKHLPQDNEQQQWTADLDAAADLIAGMAQRVPLSEEQIMDLVRDDCGVMRWPSTVLDIARAVEHAHGIRSEE